MSMCGKVGSIGSGKVMQAVHKELQMSQLTDIHVLAKRSLDSGP